MDPQGIHVWSFKVPTEVERAHDFLWRHHLCTPQLSMVAVFNRSYYEAVVVEAVKKIATAEVVNSRYPHINDFELLLTQSRTIVAKFFLHISKEEQKNRLLARQESVETAWKLSLGDWLERERWDDYQRASSRQSMPPRPTWAPWYVVPSDRKWYRNLAVAQVLVEILSPYKDDWVRALRERSERELAAIRAAGFLQKLRRPPNARGLTPVGLTARREAHQDIAHGGKRFTAWVHQHVVAGNSCSLAPSREASCRE